jgi:hypothetical protein
VVEYVRATWDVFIVSTKTKRIVSVIGRSLGYANAERRLETGVSRIEVGPYFVQMPAHNPDLRAGDKYK